jgi:hypothetical protein
MMNVALLDELQSIPCSDAADLVTEAERELAAYLLAVKEVHGPNSVNMAAEHWMKALDEICLIKTTAKEPFRVVTYSALSMFCHS